MNIREKYMKMGFIPLSDAPERYFIHPNGSVLSFPKNRKPLILKKTKCHGVEQYNLYPNGCISGGVYASVNQIKYCAINGCSLASIRGKYTVLRNDGMPIVLNDGAFMRKIQKEKPPTFPPKGDMEILGKYRDTFEAQMNWYEHGDIGHLMEIIQSIRPAMIHSAMKANVIKSIAEEITDEAILIYLERIGKYTFISCSLQKYLCSMARSMAKVFLSKRRMLRFGLSNSNENMDF